MWATPGTPGGPDPLDRLRPGYTPSQDPALRARKMRRGLIVLGSIAALAFSMGWNPPTGSVHSFTKASDYRLEKESGCTNSGEGCHGSEESYRDFNAYHPNARCTTCHQYQGVGCIPCHKDSKEHECPACHDGSLKQASDRVRLGDPYPKGHYRETSHTALGTDMTREMRASTGGEAKAACNACHSRDLKKAHTGVPAVPGSTYGPDVGCGDCHNDVRQSGQAEVLADWKSRTCESCHKVGTASATHATDVAGVVKATGPLGCGQTGSGCHAVNDLHALHPDKPVSCAGSATAGEPGCHNLAIESHAPTVTACGGTAEAVCHRGYAGTSLAHDKDAELHSPTTRVPAEDTSFEDVACGDCHRMEPDGRSLIDEHDVWTSERKRRPGDVCRDCHNDPASAVAVADDWEVRDSIYACEACHGAEGLDAAHARELGPLHSAEDGSEGCASTGAGCHPTGDLLEVGEPTIKANIHATCLRCHDWREADGNGAYDPRRSTCGEGRDCHGGADGYDTATGVHDGAGGLADGIDEDHHTADDLLAGASWADPKAGTKTACTRCHSAVLGTEHGRVSANLRAGAGTLCVRCHDAGASAVKAGWPGKDGDAACVACHGKTGVPAAHTSIETSHQGLELKLDGTYALGACARAGCHTTTELRQLHSKVGCTPFGCHSATGDVFGSQKRGCGGGVAAGACHSGYTENGGGHTGVAIVHSPRGTAQASDSSFRGVACGACHDIRATGTSLIEEHALLTSTRTVVPGDTCLNCHSAAGSAAAIADDWAARESASACAACHRAGGVSLPHTGDLPALHDSPSAGCASSGGGCHPVADLSDVGTPTAAGGIHATCLRCHDRTASGGNGAYDPTKRTCGSGRDCHGVAGQYDTTTQVHAGIGGSANGTDTDHHTAGNAQAVAVSFDASSGLSTACNKCHQMALGTEHGRPNSKISTTLAGPGPVCPRCHNFSSVTATAVKDSWPAKAATGACDECHSKPGFSAVHGSVNASHTAVERTPTGTITPGYCVRAGCHISADVRVVHKYSANGCAISSCHLAAGNIFTTRPRMSCGGRDAPLPASPACHRTFSETTHTIYGVGVVNHSAETTWTIGGTAYQTSELGCFGCHPNDLTSVHSTALIAGSMEGGGSTRCAVCHEHVMPVRGAFATLTAVQGAIDAGDRRCAACHASGSAVDGPDAVASAHKDMTATVPLPGGKVWSDPFNDWRTAFDAPTGGGHNTLPYLLVGASEGATFPVTTFTTGSVTYTWSLPPNSGTTLWLDTTTYPEATSTEAIQHLKVTCDDCHVIPVGALGPHGAAVRVYIDPGYSQTEYSNPTTNAYQFEPTHTANPLGYQPVICFKCHTIDAGSVPGTTAPGGVSRHKTHWKYSTYTTTTAGIWGAKCIDCHVRIPHAWRRPRLLVRTAATTDGATPDTFPYIAPGHTGLVGIKLQNYSGLTMSPSACAQNGCFNNPRATFHPTPAQIPTAALWP